MTGRERRWDGRESGGSWGTRHFFEGAGAGLFADYLYERKRDDATTTVGTKTEQVKQHVRELRRRWRRHPARKWTIKLDGEDFSGRYLPWHVMNIRSVGPALQLAPEAATDDGRLDFVGAREEDRALLLECFAVRLAGKRKKFPLPTRRLRKVRLRWKKAPLHFDDEIWPADDEKRPKPCEIKLEMPASALTIWRSHASSARRRAESDPRQCARARSDGPLR